MSAATTTLPLWNEPGARVRFKTWVLENGEGSQTHARWSLLLANELGLWQSALTCFYIWFLKSTLCNYLEYKLARDKWSCSARLHIMKRVWNFLNGLFKCSTQIFWTDALLRLILAVQTSARTRRAPVWLLGCASYVYISSHWKRNGGKGVKGRGRGARAAPSGGGCRFAGGSL